MPGINIETLPKILGYALMELFEDEKLVQWNIHNNGNVTNISLRFCKPGHDGQSVITQPKRKSPSQTFRDNSRSMSWHQSTPMDTHTSFPNSDENGKYNFGNIKSRNISLSACAPSYILDMDMNSGQKTGEAAESGGGISGSITSTHCLQTVNSK